MTTVPVPFTFEAWLKSSGARSKPTIVMDSIDVDIPDLSDADVTAAATVVLTHRFRMDKLAFFRHRMVLDGDRLLGPSVGPVADFKAGSITQERYMSRAAKGADNLSRAAWPDLRHLGAFGKVTPREELSGGIIRHNRDLCAERARQTAASARFVDGVLYRPSSQPVYYRDGKGGVSPKLLNDIKGQVKSLNIFPADDQDPLIEYVMSLPPKDQDGILDRRTIHLHDASIVTWDRHKAAGIDAARDVVSKFSRYLVELPRDAVERWLNLRDLVDEGDAEVVEAARDFIEIAAACGIRPSGLELPEPKNEQAATPSF